MNSCVWKNLSPSPKWWEAKGREEWRLDGKAIPWICSQLMGASKRSISLWFMMAIPIRIRTNLGSHQWNLRCLKITWRLGSLWSRIKHHTRRCRSNLCSRVKDSWKSQTWSMEAKMELWAPQAESISSEPRSIEAKEKRWPSSREIWVKPTCQKALAKTIKSKFREPRNWQTLLTRSSRAPLAGLKKPTLVQ